MKRCSRCKHDKTDDQFNVDKRYKSGLGSRCKPCNSAVVMESRARHPDTIIAYRKKWREDNIERVRQEAREKYVRVKRVVMEHYGDHECACCAISDLVFLSIDHIAGDGAERRRAGHGTGYKMYQWLINEGFPEGFQVLCFNCNWAKSHGGCPHQEKR